MKNKSLNLKTKELMKRAVSFITAVAMVITILPLQPITAFAEGTPDGYTYDAGSNTYTVSTFDGLAAALAAGGNIVLNNNITKDNPNAETPVPAGVAAVLDLNGKTITLAYGEGTIYDVISVYGKLTIKDSATGGTIDASANSVAGALSCESGSTLTIESGTYKSGDINPDIAIYGGNIDIKGGTFIGGNSLWVSDDADIDIYGGTFDNDLIINYGTTDIHGGVIKCLVIDSQEIDSVTIHGGQIDELYDNNNAPLRIKGGTFGFDPSQYIDIQNYKVVDGGENKYTVECLHNDIKGGIVTPNNNGTHTFECAVCEKTINEECYGGTASCTEKAVCTVCSTAYGQLNGHSFGADNVCTVCGLTGGYCGAATNEGGVESLLWTLSDGTLTISGNGAMADYDRADNYAPWFNHRNDITKAVVNSGVTTIGDDAFTSCTVMTKCQIPETVTSIGESAFTYCKTLTAINVDAANTAYKSVDGVLFTKDGSTLVKYPEGKTATEYTIPSTVRTIGDLAFFAAENLEKVIIPNGVTAIGKETFGSCASLTEITFQSSDITVASDAFIDCNALTTVNAPCDWLETTYKFADTVTVNLQHSYDNGFCTICDGYQPAVLTADKYDLNKDGEKDSVYEIGNAGQLYWFIDFVGNGNYHAYAVLTDDIVVNEGNVYGCNGTKAEGWREWTPVNYSGVFDGQGHTVSGIYCNVTSPYDVGFIGFLYCDSGYAAVQNLGVVNSYFNGRRTGGIVGKVQQKNSRNIAKVVNCYSQVYLMGGETSGAIVGQLWDGTVENCYSYGENAAGVAGYAGSYANVINCYYNKDLYKGSAIWSNNGTTDRVEYKTTQQFASGEVAYLLQGSQTERVWGQDIDNGNPAQPYPVFAGAQVNYGHRNCGDIEKTYTNSAVSDTAFSHTDITHFATGNVITATCGACTKAAGTVTVTAYTKVYDGAEHGLITVEATGTLAGGTYTVTYTGENYNSTTAPTDAGEYTASVTVGGATASAQFTIIKATLTADDFTFTPPVERVYDGEEKQATVTTDKTGMGEITVHYYNSDGEEAAPVDAGTYTVKIDVAESENYSAVTGLTDNYWTFSIQKADPVFTAPQAIEGLAYTGQPQVLVTPGTSDHGTFFYHIIGDEDSPELPTGTEVRTYEISWQLKGDKNHFNSSPKYLNVTISTADQTPLKITGIPDTVTYGDIFKLSATGGDGQGGMSWAVSRGSYNATIDQQGNVTVKGTGDFTVTLIRYGDHHYNDASVSHTFTSQPKQLTDAVVSVDGGLVYNGAPHTPAVSVTLDGVTLEENTDYILEYNNNINASAQATVTATGMGNYAGTVTKTFTVDKAEPTADMFTVTYPSDMVYDGNAKTVTATVKAGFTGVGDILVKYYDENGYLVNQAVNAGKYTVKLSVSEGENCRATQEPIFLTDGSSWEFEITKATYDMYNVKWNRTTGEPFEFDGNTHTVELTGLPQGVTVSYAENSKTAVGSYIAKAELNYDSENYNTPDAIPSLEWYIEWNAAENKDYTINSAGTPNSDGWYNSQIHIIPADDYIFYTNNDASEEDLITLNEDTADGSVTFRVYDPETLSMSYGKTVTYKLDTTAPTGTVSVEENSWTAFLNSITFNKFFNKTVDVKVEAADITSGVKSVEYIESSTALTLDELKQIANWTDMGADNKASVTAEEAKQFVYYIRITDNADNVTIISTDGMAFDLTTPVITGVTNGTTYYTTQKFTVTEANIADVKVNDNAVTDYTLAGNVDATYKVVVTDKAGNSTTVTVTMKTIASISESIKDLTESNVTGDNADIIKEAEETLAAVDTTYATDAEKAEIAAAQANVDALQKAIEDTEKEVSDIEAETGALNPDTVTSDDKAEVEQFIGEMTDKLDDANLTEAQKDRIQQSIDEAKEILDKIAEDQENLNDAFDSVPAVDTDNVTDSDIDNLEEVKENLEELLNDENYTAEEKAEIQGKLDEIKDIANDIGETYEIVHGADGKWTKGASKTLGFTADGLFKLFVEVRVDGNVIIRDVDYTAQSGSTIVTFNKDYLDTLSVGKHKLEVVYDILGEESIADCEFTVKAKPADNSDKTEPATTPAPSPVPTAKPTAKPTVTPEPSEEPVEEPDTTITEVDPGDETQQKDEVETVTPQEPAETSSFPVLPIIIAVAAIFIIIIIFKKKNKEETEE